MGVDTKLGRWIEDIAVGAQAVAYRAHREVTTGISDVNAVRPVGLHELGLLGELRGGRHVAHHQKRRDVHPKLARGSDVLRGYIRLRAVGGNANRPDSE